jgi:hypothetical protein
MLGHIFLSVLFILINNVIHLENIEKCRKKFFILRPFPQARCTTLLKKHGKYTGDIGIEKLK